MNSSGNSGPNRKENERTKLIQEKCQTLLTQMLRDEDNKYCVDCDAKGPRWASWNLGVFLCIRCAGIHRNLGVHISRVKSVNLDTWTPEQVISLQQMGNSRARAVYEAQLPDGFRRPQTDTALESFIRAKYEHKKYLAREWVPPSPPKVDWAKEIDEELERQKRKKKAAQAGNALGMGVLTGSSSSAADKKPSLNNANKNTLPAPLPKPKPGQCGSSPKTQRGVGASVGSDFNQQQQQNNDLLGLCSPTKPVQASSAGSASSAVHDLQNDSFSGFLSAAPSSEAGSKPSNDLANASNSLAKEEEDFFNQGSLGNVFGAGEKDKSGKLTTDSILALYSSANTAASNPLINTQPMNFGQQQQTQAMFGGFNSGGAFMGSPAAHHQQFMTPPNSTSMYNNPVMTAPVNFSAPSMQSMASTASVGGFAGMQNNSAAAFGFPQQQQQQPQQQQPTMMPMMGLMSTGVQPQQQQHSAGNLNLMHTNQSLLSGLTMNATPTPHQQQQHPAMHMGASMAGMPTAGAGMMHNMGSFHQMPNSAATSGNLNQQFGNLNIGNVWQ